MDRFFVLPEKIKGKNIYVDQKELHHIRDVFRLKKGDELLVFDGTGKEYTCFIEFDSPKELILTIKDTAIKKQKKDFSISLAQSIPKKDTMDYIIAKATELGVMEFFPIISERTIKRISQNNSEKLRARWQKISVESAKQCGRADLPNIFQAEDFKAFLKKIEGFDLILLPTLNKDTILLKDALKKKPKRVLAIIGPEGDFTQREVDLAKEEGAVAISLGENVLRCDTAVIYALSVLNYELGN